MTWESSTFVVQIRDPFHLFSGLMTSSMRDKNHYNAYYFHFSYNIRHISYIFPSLTDENMKDRVTEKRRISKMKVTSKQQNGSYSSRFKNGWTQKVSGGHLISSSRTSTISKAEMSRIDVFVANNLPELHL